MNNMSHSVEFNIKLYCLVNNQKINIILMNYTRFEIIVYIYNPNLLINRFQYSITLNSANLQNYKRPST